MDKTSVEEVHKRLSELTGQIIWGVRRGVGTFITMDFGQPHLKIREPIVARRGVSSKVRKLLAQRRVFITGDWHLWIQDGDWYIAIGDEQCHMNCTFDAVDGILQRLDGQIVKSVLLDQEKKELTLEFDLGGRVKVLPWHEEIKGDTAIWSLHTYKRDIVFINNDGTRGREELK